MKKNYKKYFIFILLFFTIILIYVIEQIESKRMLIRLDKLNSEKNKQIEIYSKLQVEYTRLTSPERLDEIAKKQKFIIPQEEKIIYIREENENNKR
ncbi:MAG: cell division protein FtsL [Endomicrobiia bacterium]